MTSCEGRGSNLTETNGKCLKIKKKNTKAARHGAPGRGLQQPWLLRPRGGHSPALGPCHCSALSCQPPASGQCSAKPPAAASVPRQAAPSSQARKHFVICSSWLCFCRPQVPVNTRCSLGYWFSVGLCPIPSTPQSDHVCSLIGCGAEGNVAFQTVLSFWKYLKKFEK